MMKISPPILTIGSALALGGGATALMMTSSNDSARKTRMAVNVFGGAIGGLSLLVGAGLYTPYGHGIDEAARGAQKWAQSRGSLTGLTHSGSLAMTGLGILAGVAMTNMAAKWVMPVHDRALAGNG